MAAGHFSEAEEKHTLEMTPDEAQTLSDVLASVSGPPEGRRRHVQSLLSALRSGGTFHSGAPDVQGDIWIDDDDYCELAAVADYGGLD